MKVFLKGDAKDTYLELKGHHDKVSKSILSALERIKNRLKENPQLGNPIPRRLFPEEFVKDGVQNLYRVQLPGYWRLIYTINGNKIEILVFVLFIGNHKKYDSLFGYK